MTLPLCKPDPRRLISAIEILIPGHVGKLFGTASHHHGRRAVCYDAAGDQFDQGNCSFTFGQLLCEYNLTLKGKQ